MLYHWSEPDSDDAILRDDLTIRPASPLEPLARYDREVALKRACGLSLRITSPPAITPLNDNGPNLMAAHLKAAGIGRIAQTHYGTTPLNEKALKSLRAQLAGAPLRFLGAIQRWSFRMLETLLPSRETSCSHTMVSNEPDGRLADRIDAQQPRSDLSKWQRVN